MKTIRASVGLAVGLALVGGLTTVGWSQEARRSASSTTDPPLFASVSSYVLANIPALEKRYVASLEFSSAGVVEAALRETIRVKLAQPSVTSESLEEEFKALAAEGETPAIRYKAMLGLQVVENPGLFIDLAYREFKTDDEMFTAISRELEKSLLAHTS